MISVWSSRRVICIVVIASCFSLSFIQQRLVRTTKLFRNQLFVSLSSNTGSVRDISTALASVVDESVDGRKYCKRKVALVFSYVGSAYNGLQFDTTQTFTTIESVVQQAFFDVGCIKPTNFNDLTKISWSRSSRTDKGVHCARLVLSAKLELDTNWLKGDKNDPGVDKGVISNIESQKVRMLPELVNALLPSDIRLISCIRLTQSFRARQACYWREYEYLLPLQPLLAYKPQQQLVETTQNTTPTPASTILTTKAPFSRREQILTRLDFALRKLEGSRSYHNFHRMKRRDMKPQGGGRKWKNNSETINISDNNSNNGPSKSISVRGSIGKDEDCDDEEEEEEDDDNSELGIDSHQLGNDIYQSTSVSNDSIEQLQLPMTNLFQRWFPSPREVVPKTQGSIYCSEVLNVEEVDGVEMVHIRVRGKSFLLHQIRVIVGSAIFYAHDMIPEVVLDAALLVPLHVPLPMAPAEGLILADSGYMQNLKPKTILWTLCPAKHTVSALRREDSFLNDTEYAMTEEFKKSMIYKQVVKAWGVTSVDESSSCSSSSTSHASSKTNNHTTTTSSSSTDILTDWLGFNEERYSMYCKNSDSNNSNNSSATAIISDNTEPTPQEEAFWQNLIRQQVTENKAITSVQKAKVEKEVLRRMRFIRIFNENRSNLTSNSSNTNTLITNNSDDNSSISGTSTTNSNSTNSSISVSNNNNKNKAKPVREEEFDYQDFLPTGMNTALTVVTRVNPGKDINQGLRALAFLLTQCSYDDQGYPSSGINNNVDSNNSSSESDRSNSIDNVTATPANTNEIMRSVARQYPTISLQWDCDELAEYVQCQGGLSWLLSLPVHRLIK